MLRGGMIFDPLRNMEEIGHVTQEFGFLYGHAHYYRVRSTDFIT